MPSCSMVNNQMSLDDLERGIERLLLEDRCSFSDEEKVLLIECVSLIKEFRRNSELTSYVKILEILLKFFLDNNTFTDFF